MTTSDVRVRRPKTYEVLIQQLRDDAGFPTMRDILLFAAALGKFQGRRQPFDESSEPIRYETLTDPAYAATLVNMLAAVTEADDPEVLSGSRLTERVRIFEEFANGGLEYLQEQKNVRQLPLNLLVAALVTEALDEAAAQPAPIDDLLEGMF